MKTLQYFDGTKWIDCGKFVNENLAWSSLGGDNLNYRVIDENGKVLIFNVMESWKDHVDGIGG